MEREQSVDNLDLQYPQTDKSLGNRAATIGQNRTERALQYPQTDKSLGNVARSMEMMPCATVLAVSSDG